MRQRYKIYNSQKKISSTVEIVEQSLSIAMLPNDDHFEFNELIFLRIAFDKIIIYFIVVILLSQIK